MTARTLAPTRRGAIRLGLGTGLGVLGAMAINASDLARAGAQAASTSAAAATTSGCATLTPELTQGPFWVDELLNRSDIRLDTEGGDPIQTGVPVQFTLTVLDATSNCSPQIGAFVDVWHCSCQGAYSDVSGSGNPDERGHNYLRGYQATDANGQVSFTTVFPGWYVSRTAHIHFRVRTSLDSSTTLNFTSQLFFTDAVQNAVYAQTAYKKSGTRTTNSTDQLYDAALVLPLDGSTSAGYSGAFTVMLDIGDGVDGGDDGGDGGTADTSVQASIAAVSVGHSAGRRVITVRTNNAETVAPVFRLLDDDDVIVRVKHGWWSPGTRTRQLVVPTSVHRGDYTLSIKFTDKAGNTKYATRTVTVPKRNP